MKCSHLTLQATFKVRLVCYSVIRAYLCHTAGYEFLMQNCKFILPKHEFCLTSSIDTDGDKICIFGFSRGAYTARAVAGMLQKVLVRSTSFLY